MKKTIIAMAALGAISSFAYAESNVTLYGVVDLGISSEHVTGVSGNPVSFSSGFRNGDRWGIRGVEDLGNGYQVGFILEQGFNVDDGTIANGVDNNHYGFSREAKLYIQGGFGQLGFGRLGSLAGGAQSNNMLTGWAFGTSYGGGAWTKLAIGNGRLDNAVAYVSPTFGGFKFSLQYSNGLTYDPDTVDATGILDNGDPADYLYSGDTAKWSKNSHYYGIGAQYAFGGFTNSLIFEAVDNKAVNPNEGNRKTKYLINLGLGYDFGPITPMFAYQYNWQDEGIKDHVFGLSAKIPLAGGTALVGARYLFGKNDGAAAGAEDKRRVWTINAGYEYPLSKRTTLYAYAGYADGSKALSDSLKAGQKIQYNGYQAAIGMTHNF